MYDEPARKYAFRTLMDNIASCALAPTTSITETEICAELGLSKTPVREALQELAKDGFVEIMPQRGVRIAPIDSSLVDEGQFIRMLLENAVVELICER